MVYILASKPYGTLYVGVTSKLADRIEAHRNGRVDGFTKQYGAYRWCTLRCTLTCTRRFRGEGLKKWNRAWKIRLIEEMNPEWKDLCAQAF